MRLQIHIRKKWGGYEGSVACVIHGRRFWSESTGIVRLTREDARDDAEWLREWREMANRAELDKQTA